MINLKEVKVLELTSLVPERSWVVLSVENKLAVLFLQWSHPGVESY